MVMYRHAIAAAVFSVLVAIVTPANAVSPSEASVNTQRTLDGGHIVLDSASNVVVRTWVGDALCTEGDLLLAHPQLKSTGLPAPTPASRISSTDRSRFVSSYHSDSERRVLGPYPAKTELILELVPGTTWCSGSHWLSTDRFHAHLERHGRDCWTLAWEDATDGDFNDAYTEVCKQPAGNVLTDEIKVAKVPHYRLPWPNGSHLVTEIPGNGEHKRWAAYDFDMRQGQPVSASTDGVVLWVEDSFGPGACSTAYDSRGNVIVIQADIDVHLVYLHLGQGSAVVRVGDVVRQGQVIASAGNSGHVCGSDGGDGSHTHFQWQHDCYSDVSQANKRRGKIGEPSIGWSCTSYPASAPFGFWIGGKLVAPTYGTYTAE